MTRRPCEVALSITKGTEIRKALEEATGLPCRCDRGLTCPLFPEEQERLRQQDRQQPPE